MTRGGKASETGPLRDDHRIQVEDEGSRRPFMRGIMVHSLMARGVSFEEAYRTADRIRSRIRGRRFVKREELAELVHELVGGEDVLRSRTPIALPPNIQVGEAGDFTPFSKGVLSQSLLAASVDPTDAFDVAREIELDLVRSGTRSISRQELRRRAHGQLFARFGAETAERYLVWRRYQDPDKPVIVLLGGATGAGKTSLALEVALRLGISRVLSTDSIRQVMRIMLSPELVPALHHSSFDAYRDLAAPASNTSVVQGAMAQASIVSVGVRAMMDRAVAENTSLVLDGVALVPGLIDLAAYKDKAYVVFLVVAQLDEEAFRRRLADAGGRRAAGAPDRYVERFDEISRIQEQFLELADRYDVPIVDSTSIERAVLLVIRHVVGSLRTRGDFDASELL